MISKIYIFFILEIILGLPYYNEIKLNIFYFKKSSSNQAYLNKIKNI